MTGEFPSYESLMSKPYKLTYYTKSGVYQEVWSPDKENMLKAKKALTEKGCTGFVHE